MTTTREHLIDNSNLVVISHQVTLEQLNKVAWMELKVQKESLDVLLLFLTYRYRCLGDLLFVLLLIDVEGLFNDSVLKVVGTSPDQVSILILELREGVDHIHYQVCLLVHFVGHLHD